MNLRAYETVIVFDPDIGDEKKKEVLDRVKEIIAQFDGEVEKIDRWGVRELAYPIKKKKKGDYFIVYYRAKPGVVHPIEDYFRVTEEVMRFLSVQRKKEVKDEQSGKANTTAATTTST